jgi:hypothetical protein
MGYDREVIMYDCMSSKHHCLAIRSIPGFCIYTSIPHA